MASNKTRNKWLGANLCRLLLSLTFAFSGMVKLIDPRGTQYKIEDYSVLFGIYSFVTPLLALSLAVALAMLEFYLGFNLFFGIRRRTTTRLTVIVMSVMTPLTFFLALSSTQMDCGCFGDAVHLTNWQTFGKNLVLLVAAVVSLWSYRHLTRFISERNQWLLSLYALVFALFLALYNIRYLPVIDFRPYRIGTDLPKAIIQDWEQAPEKMRYSDFSMLTAEGEDITIEWLEQPGYKFLLVAPFLETADDGSMEKINALYDYCQQQDYPFLALTSSGQESIDRWKDLTGAEYDFAQSDGTALKTVIRSNPGLLMFHDGVVYKKWSVNDLPAFDEQTAPIEETKMGQMSENGRLRAIYRLLLWFLVPLVVWTLIDRIWVGQTLYKRHKIHKRINSLLPQTKTITEMRKKIVAGNWKMNLNLQEGVALATELKGALAADKPNCDVVICTPFIHLATVAGIVKDTVIGLGAENCADKEKGAYTGEVSAAQVKSTGAQYVILGHSERRAYYGETPEILKEKVNLALTNGLKVIFCIGEVLEEREAGKQNEVVGGQLADSLFDLTDEQFANIILAYEPVWAIGTGKTATAEQAQDMHEFIRGVIAGRFGDAAAENVSILYGGSCKPSNAKEIFSKPDVDGGLIGGAALKCADFKGIIDAWKD